MVHSQRPGGSRFSANRAILTEIKRIKMGPSANTGWQLRHLRAGIDADTVTGADLAAIPTMTKADVMEHWDEIVTDPRLTLELAETHLERVASEGPAYLLGEYQVLHIVQVQPTLVLS